MIEPEFKDVEVEEDFPDNDEADDIEEIEAEDSEDEEELVFLADEDDDAFDPNNPKKGINRVNARRALEDYFEEKLRREEESYFDEFSISLDDD